jgi:hypothetical protein
MYIFIAIIFIAELIIAFNLIAWILKADRVVCEYSLYVKAFNPLAQTCLQYARCKVSELNKMVVCVFDYIKKKREQVVTKTIFMIGVYAILVLFKIKKKKVSKIYKLISLIRDLALELVA